MARVDTSQRQHRDATAAPGRAAVPPTAGPTRGSLDALEGILGPTSGWDFAARLPDGTRVGSRSPAFTLVLQRPERLRRLLLRPTERSLGEAYVRGDIDVEGDLERAVAVVRERVLDPSPSLRRALGLLRHLFSPPAPSGDGIGPPEGSPEREADGPTGSDAGRGGTDRPRPDRRGAKHSRDRDARSVRFHYDTGNDFFDLWLDPWLQYSSGYFPTGEEGLAEAQERKLELLCRKLGLSPGHRLLDVGCGWGGLVRWAATRHGVEALGITLSEAQADRARSDIRASGLADRCRIEVMDYRELERRGEGDSFDRIVSVGMVEHVGRSRLGEYYGRMARLLRPGGLLLVTGITDPGPGPSLPVRLLERFTRGRRSFVDAHVFPDGELVAPTERLEAAATAGLELRHAQELREHYARTLRHWVRRLEARWDEAVERAGAATARTWRLYMAGAAHGFATGRLGLLHELHARSGGERARPPPPPGGRQDAIDTATKPTTNRPAADSTAAARARPGARGR